MATNNIFHTKTIIEEICRFLETDLKTTLGLRSVMEGDLSQFATPGLTNIVPGIWIQPSPTMNNDFGSLPKEMLQQYYFRIVYVRLLARNENFVTKNMNDGQLIGNTIMDHYYLTDITNLPTGTQVLWSIVKNIEYQCPEDRFVQQIHADLAAVAFNLEVNVITRRST